MTKELIRAPIRRRPQSIQDVIHEIETIQRWAESISRVINNLVSNIPSDSTAVDVAGVVSDLNSLQGALRDLNVR